MAPRSIALSLLGWVAINVAVAATHDGEAAHMVDNDNEEKQWLHADGTVSSVVPSGAWDHCTHDPQPGCFTRPSHIDMHALFASETDPSMFDADGLYLPPKNVEYDPTAMTRCCVASCLAAEQGKEAQRDCEVGCQLWLHHSSLNWEGRRWHPKLHDKCRKDCSAVKMWNAHRAAYPQYNISEHALADIAPEDSTVCRRGCDRYWACMIDATYPTKAKCPYVLYSNDILNHASEHCGPHSA